MLAVMGVAHVYPTQIILISPWRAMIFVDTHRDPFGLGRSIYAGLEAKHTRSWMRGRVAPNKSLHIKEQALNASRSSRR